MSQFIQRPSGLMIRPTKPEPPKEKTLFMSQRRCHGDLIIALKTIDQNGAELVSVGRAGKSGGLMGGVGYVVVYLAERELSFEELC